MAGYVYVLSNPCVKSRKGKTVFKIGFTTNLPRRLGTLNTSVPENFKVVALYKVDDPAELEKFTKGYLHEEIKTSDGSPTEFYAYSLDYIVGRILKCAKDHHIDLIKEDGSIYVGRSESTIRSNLKKFRQGEGARAWKNVNQLAKALVDKFTPGKTHGGVTQLLNRDRACKTGPWHDRLQSVGLKFDGRGFVIDWRKAKRW